MRALALACALLAGCGSRPKQPARVAPVPVPQEALSQAAYAHYLRGQIAVLEEDWPEAVTQLRAARTAAPKESNISLALSKALYHSGDVQASLAQALLSTQLWPNAFPVWAQAGEVEQAQGHHKLAAAHYLRAIKIGARSEAVHLAYASQLRRLGNLKEEEAQYRMLLSKTAGSATVHYRLARLMHYDGRHVAATKHLSKASVQSPYDLRVWALLSTSLSKEGRNEEAKQALRMPFDRSGGNTFTAQQLLSELLDLGNLAAAHGLVQTLDRSDLPIDSRIGMGYLQLHLGDFEAALQTTLRLDAKLASNAAIAELRGRALRGLHRDDEAAAQLLLIQKHQKAYPLIQSILAELLADQGHFERASELLKQALAAWPDQPDLILARASVLEKSADREGARRTLRAALEAHPKARRALFALAELETRAGNAKEAIALIEPLVESDPGDASALNYVGYSLIEDPSQRKRAGSLLRRALHLTPDSSFLLDSYGWLLFRSGDIKRAAAYIGRAARLSPAEPELLWHLAEIRWWQGERTDALRILRQAESLALGAYLRNKIQRRREILSAKP